MGGMNLPQSDWLDQLIDAVNTQQPEGEILVSSGHSPSGVYHIGTLREIMTASAITWALRQSGRQARHVDVVDDFDAFRKVPAGVPEEWKRYIGVPLRVTPDPFECHDSYGAHYLTELNAGLAEIGCTPDEQLSGFDMYQSGSMAPEIVRALDHLEEARQILTEVGGRQLDEHWAPVQLWDDQQNLRNQKFAGWDSARQMVKWRDRDGQEGEVAVDSGRVKLDWRLDWPARWAKLGVGVEPFGRDHATKGGSYDTGKVIVDKIFGGRAPYPVPYEFIVTAGETKKMSKSAGNVLTPRQAMAVMPAEVLRYFVVGPRPSRTLTFDSGLGLYNLIDEFGRVRTQPTAAVRFARANAEYDTISGVPFNHLVAVVQAARFDLAVVREVLSRTGFESNVAEEWPVIERELTFVKRWLEQYAPDSVKFEVQDTLPDTNLADNQRQALKLLADTIEAEHDLNGQGMHDAIYAAALSADVKPAAVFVAIYQAILGQDKGPKAGWFLASLEHDWLVARLRDASK